MPRAQLLDLCNEKDVASVRHDLALDWMLDSLGPKCENPAGYRFVGQSPSGVEKSFSALELVEARRWIERENARVRATFFAPTRDDFFGPETDERGCRSRGLKKIPDAASAHESVRADVDGDGRADRVSIYMLGDRFYATEKQRLRAELATGLVYDVKNDWWIDGFYGATDLDQDDRSEVWYAPNTNKPGAISLFVFRNCRLRNVMDGRSSFMLDAYGGGPESVGVECRNGQIIDMEFRSWSYEDFFPDGTDLEEFWRYSAYRLDDAQVVRVEEGSGGEWDARPSRFGWKESLSCPALR